MGRSVFRPPLWAVAFAALGTQAALAASDDPVLKRADELLGRQQAKSAYELLAPLEDERAGEPEYDYLFGLAALEVGEPGRAAFAFERCLSVEPKNGPCRVQMARTHMALGENRSAERELHTVRDYSPPPEVARLVDTYLGTLAERQRAARYAVNAWAQIGFGTDSNVTSANDRSQVALPALGGLVFTLDPQSLKKDDSFAAASAGLNARYNLDPSWSLLGDLGLNLRGYQDLDRFDSRAVDVGAGAGYRLGASQFTLKAQAQDYVLDNEDFRQVWGGMFQYQYTVSERTQFSSFLQGSRLDYVDQSPRNADRYTLGVALSQAVAARYNPVVYASAYGGTEDTRNDDPKLNAKAAAQDFYGLRTGGALFLTQALQLNGSLSIEQRDFKANFGGFKQAREETQYDLSLGLVYAVSRELSVRPAYSYTRNDSNIQITDYDRHVLNLDIRYEL